MLRLLQFALALRLGLRASPDYRCHLQRNARLFSQPVNARVALRLGQALRFGILLLSSLGVQPLNLGQSCDTLVDG